MALAYLLCVACSVTALAVALRRRPAPTPPPPAPLPAPAALPTTGTADVRAILLAAKLDTAA